MDLTETKIGQVLAVIAHIGTISPIQRTEQERYWMGMAETAISRLWGKRPLHLRRLAAKIDIILGELVVGEVGEAPKQVEDLATSGQDNGPKAQEDKENE